MYSTYMNVRFCIDIHVFAVPVPVHMYVLCVGTCKYLYRYLMYISCLHALGSLRGWYLWYPKMTGAVPLARRRPAKSPLGFFCAATSNIALEILQGAV